jgi:hypothetical protein
MDATAVGLWLAGLGAAAAVGSTLLKSPPEATGGLRFNSPESARGERLHLAIETVSLAFVALGSAIFAIAELPNWWIMAGSVAGFALAVWLHGAWSQHRVWAALNEEAQRGASSEGAEAYPLMRWKAQCTAHCSRWRWALLHPFNGQTWPNDFTRRYPRPD